MVAEMARKQSRIGVVATGNIAADGLQDMVSQLDPETITPQLAARVPESLRKQLLDLVASIRRLSPDSTAATRADEIATELGLEEP